MTIELNKEQQKCVKKHQDFEAGHQIGTEKERRKIVFSLLWLSTMDPFNTAPGFILDLIFHKLNEEDLHEALRVSKSWFWASVRRTKKLKITMADNPLKSIAEFYNNHRPADEKLDWRDLFKYLLLDELIVINDTETTNYLVNNGCNTAELTIEDFHEETPVTLSSLKTITRLQTFEYCNTWDIKWHPFIIECLKSSDCEFDPNNLCPIAAIKLKSSGWNTDDPVLHSVTKLGVLNATIDFLHTIVDHCLNLEELHCTYGTITEEWYQVVPANVKSIELHYFDVDSNLNTVVNVSTDAGRQLLPYLCQNWESVEKFHFDGDIDDCGQTVYEAFPQQREEVFVCNEFDEEMNLGCPQFQSRKIHIGFYDWDAVELIIPPTKSVKLEFDVERDFKFSPRDVCLEPGKVERFALLVPEDDELYSAYLSKSWPKEFTIDPFGSNSFEGFSRLTSLTLSQVSAMSIKIALDQCQSIKKLKLKYLKESTIGSMSSESSYGNVSELVLEGCEETMYKVFHVFPRLSKFKQSERRIDELATDWLWRHLIEVDKKYGLVFERYFRSWFIVRDDLQASLDEAQKLLNENLHRESVCYLKGFKLIPRVSKQKVTYLN